MKIKFLTLLITLSIHLFSNSQNEIRIIVHDYIDDIIDCRSIDYYNLLFQKRINKEHRNIVLVYNDLFYIKSLKNNTSNIDECPEDRAFYVRLMDSLGTSLYGCNIDSYNLYNFLLKDNPIKYEEINQLSIKVSGIQFYELFIFGKLCEYKDITNFLVNEFSFDEIEKEIILNKIHSKCSNSDQIYKAIEKQIEPTDNLFILSSWRSKGNEREYLNYEHIYLLPTIIKSNILNKKNRKNKISNIEQYPNFSSLKFNDIPRKINVNTFVKVKKRWLNPQDTFILINR